MTASMRHALDDLRLDALLLVYPGDRRFRLADRIEALPATSLLGATDAVSLVGEFVSGGGSAS